MASWLDYIKHNTVKPASTAPVETISPLQLTGEKGPRRPRKMYEGEDTPLKFCRKCRTVTCKINHRKSKIEKQKGESR